MQDIGRRAIGLRVQPVVAQVIRLPRHRRAVVDLVGRRDVVPPAHRPVRIGQGQPRIFRSEARHREDRQAIAGQMAQADPQIARCGAVVVRPAGKHFVPRIDAGDDVQLRVDMHRRDRPHRLECQQVIGDVGQGVERARRGIEPFISHQPRRQPQLEIDAARRQHRRVDHDIGLRQDELIAAGERPIEQADGRRIARVGPEQPLQVEAHVHPRTTRNRARDRPQHLVEQRAVRAVSKLLSEVHTVRRMDGIDRDAPFDLQRIADRGMLARRSRVRRCVGRHRIGIRHPRQRLRCLRRADTVGGLRERRRRRDQCRAGAQGEELDRLHRSFHKAGAAGWRVGARLSSRRQRRRDGCATGRRAGCRDRRIG